MRAVCELRICRHDGNKGGCDDARGWAAGYVVLLCDAVLCFAVVVTRVKPSWSGLEGDARDYYVKLFTHKSRVSYDIQAQFCSHLCLPRACLTLTACLYGVICDINVERIAPLSSRAVVPVAVLLMPRITLEPKPLNSLIHCKLASLGLIACKKGFVQQSPCYAPPRCRAC